MSMQYLIRIGYHEDELGLVLKGHLVIEYLMNRIIEYKISDSKNYLKFKFSQKLQLLDKNRLLTSNISQNIKRLNKFRNNFAHTLDFIPDDEELLYTKKSGSDVHLRGEPYKGGYPIRYYYRMLVHGILTDLTNHMALTLRVDPFWHEVI